jgi:acyl-CoA synthetase (AMP-forming)/AMP-acid ligase II
MGQTTMGGLVREHARVRPNHAAFQFEGRTIAYGELDRLTNRVANGLTALGMKPGDRVAYLGKNSDAYFVFFFGATKAGFVVVPINWRLAPPEIAYIANESKARLLIVDEELVGAVAAIRTEIPTVATLLVIGQAMLPALSFWDWLGRQNDAVPRFEETQGQVIIQLYTSGTTGRPKGAMLTNGNFFGLRLTGADAGTDWDRFTADDVVMVAMPIFHIGGSALGVLSLYGGAKAIILKEFEPGAVFDAIAAGTTKTFLVPAALRALVMNPRARQVDYRRLRYILYGASPIPFELLRQCVDIFGCKFAQMYGMTETCGTIVALGPDDHDAAGSPRMRSAGKPLPGVEVAVVDENGKPLAIEQVGEIVTRSSANMPGYWNLPDATKATIDAEGWLHTGDAGYFDADGYLYIYDRVKDMIVSGAENVYPAEVESAIYGHPIVSDVCVIGVPDEKWGEAVKAVVVLKPGAAPDPASIIAWTRERIAGFKTPKSVDFTDTLPRNASGKLLRRVIREPYWKGRDRRVN